MHDVLMLKRCTICGDSVLYHGPAMLGEGDIFCGKTCAAIWDAITPGYCVDASELMQGGSLYDDRPSIRSGPLHTGEL